MPASRPLDIPQLRDGTVTAVRAQQGDHERVAVFIDGEFAFGLATEIAVRAGLRKGLALTAAEQLRLLEDEQRSRARRAALDYLGHRARTRAEIRRRLEARGFEAGIVDEAIEWLRGLGYVDDAAYARTFVKERMGSRAHGPARLRVDLLRRGVDHEIIESALDELVDEEELAAGARRLAASRWQRLKDEPDPRRRRKKLADFLRRRGYDYQLIRQVTAALEREQ